MAKQWRGALFCAVILTGCGSDDSGSMSENSGSITAQNGDGAAGNSTGSSGGSSTGSSGTSGASSSTGGDSGGANSAGNESDAGDGASTGDSDPPGDDPGAAAGVVTCGDSSCSTPDICCVSFLGGMNGGFECKAEGDCGGLTSAPGTCDGKEDCSGDESCCAKFALSGGSGAFCKATCDSDAKALCHTDGDCGAGESCIPCAPPTGGIVDLVYHLCSATPECPSPYMNVP